MKLPLQLVNDAQGPMGILDADGKAVAWFSEVFKPKNGYAYEPEKEAVMDGMVSTYYHQRNEIVRAVFAMIQQREKGTT